jgi:hypothetical protein
MVTDGRDNYICLLASIWIKHSFVWIVLDDKTDNFPSAAIIKQIYRNGSQNRPKENPEQA